MKNTFGNNVTVTLFGESHGPAVGCVLDGLPAGICVDMDMVRDMMSKRKASGGISTARHEPDEIEILSGIMDGRTQGTPIAILVRNTDVHRSDYKENILRPAHADYTGRIKYGGYADMSGGGHFSGRLTAPLTAAGAICMCMLKEKGITVGTHIQRIKDAEDRNFDETDLQGDLDLLREKGFPVLDDEAAVKMTDLILQAKAAGDSVGGILETAVCGIEAGIGEPYFDSMESVISHALFSVGAVKGIEFGAGFSFADMYGSEANDPFINDGGTVRTLTNNNGGINGGITNGMPVIFRTVIKPTPSIRKAQKTVDADTMEDTEIVIRGRHDPAIIHRAAPVVTAVTAIALSDLLVSRCGSQPVKGGIR